MGGKKLATEEAVNNALTKFEYSNTDGTRILRDAQVKAYGQYDTENAHYYKYRTIDTNGNSITGFIKFFYGNSIDFRGEVSNGITRTNQNTEGTLRFSSISQCTVYEVTENEWGLVTTSTLNNALANYVKKVTITETTESRGFISLSNYIQAPNVPIFYTVSGTVAYDISFFNGASGNNQANFMKVRDFSGNIIANTQITCTIFYI